MSTDTNTNNNTITPTTSPLSNFLHDQSCDADYDKDGESIVATGKVTGEQSSAVQSEGLKKSATDLQVCKDVRSADTTRATHERSVVRRHVGDDNHQLDPRQVLADDNLLTNDWKTAPADRKPQVVKPLFYDLGQKTLGYKELCGRIIPSRDLFNVACNYTYTLFGVALLKHDGGTNRGRVCYYKCACFMLWIRFDRKTNGVQEDVFFVLHAESFPHQLLNRSDRGTSLHQERCNLPKSKAITKPFIVLNHLFFLDCFQAFLLLNYIMAVHLKNKNIVQSIKLMFEKGNNLPNRTSLSKISWNNIVDNMIDILHQKLAREYKTLPKKWLI